MDRNYKEFSEEELRGAIGSREVKARQILEDKNKVYKLLKNAKKMIKKIKNVPVIGELVDDLLTLFDLIEDYSKGNYTKIPLRVIISAVAGVVYLVTPFDIIPDFIPVVGFLDDAAVLFFVLNMGLDLELRKYKKWKLMVNKDAFINQLECDIKRIIKERKLVAMFLTDDDTLKLLISNDADDELPIEVHPELLDFDYAQLKSICDGLNIKVLDALDKVRIRFCKFVVENPVCDIKVCRESDFSNYEETFDIIIEED